MPRREVVKQSHYGHVKLATGKRVDVKGEGDVSLPTIPLRNVLFAPRLKFNLERLAHDLQFIPATEDQKERQSISTNRELKEEQSLNEIDTPDSDEEKSVDIESNSEVSKEETNESSTGECVENEPQEEAGASLTGEPQEKAGASIAGQPQEEAGESSTGPTLRRSQRENFGKPPKRITPGEPFVNGVFQIDPDKD
ncbi:hypothetical protein lerEdw1_020828 [Lerista edwardsae]|nr:hypothetical protein lerEdw1_020828 [Lerista edwardsae]